MTIMTTTLVIMYLGLTSRRTGQVAALDTSNQQSEGNAKVGKYTAIMRPAGFEPARITPAGPFATHRLMHAT